MTRRSSADGYDGVVDLSSVSLVPLAQLRRVSRSSLARGFCGTPTAADGALPGPALLLLRLCCCASNFFFPVGM